MRIAVVGTGRVGLPLAAVSSKYFDTIALDIDEKVIQRIHEKKGFSEPQLVDYLERYDLKGTTDFSIMKNRDLVILCIGSQSPGEGYSSRNLLKALEEVTPYLKSPEQVLVITSTLPLSSVKDDLWSVFSQENVNGRILGVCYNPTMIALGSAVSDFEHPNYVLIGESTARAGERLESFWRKIVGDKPHIFRSTIPNIILAKYVLNTALTLKITLMNVVTELCEKVGGDVDFQADVLKADPRIGGQKMFKGGLGYGGTCYPVDVEAFYAECEKLGMPTALASAMQTINIHQVDRTVELIESLGQKRVTVLGITYKPDTAIVEDSQPLEIACRLTEKSYEVMLCDPQGLDEARKQLGDRVLYTKDVAKALAFGNVVLLGVEWPQFRQIDSNSFRKDQIIIDPWRIMKSSPPHCTYIPFGMAR